MSDNKEREMLIERATSNYWLKGYPNAAKYHQQSAPYWPALLTCVPAVQLAGLHVRVW